MERQLKLLHQFMQSDHRGTWRYDDGQWQFVARVGGSITGYSDAAFADMCLDRLHNAGIAVNEVEPAVIAELRRRFALPRFDGKDHQHG